MKKVVTLILAVLLLITASVTAYAAQDSASIPYEDLMYVAGDVDCDEEIKSSDMVYLRKVLLGSETIIRKVTADTNGDGEINAVDVVRLKKYLAGYDSVKLGI